MPIRNHRGSQPSTRCGTRCPLRPEHGQRPRTGSLLSAPDTPRSRCNVSLSRLSGSSTSAVIVPRVAGHVPSSAVHLPHTPHRLREHPCSSGPRRYSSPPGEPCAGSAAAPRRSSIPASVVAPCPAPPLYRAAGPAFPSAGSNIDVPLMPPAVRAAPSPGPTRSPVRILWPNRFTASAVGGVARRPAGSAPTRTAPQLLAAIASGIPCTN